MTDTCAAHVNNGFQIYLCGKPAKGKTKDGNPACGIHLRAEARREATLVESARRRDESDEALLAARKASEKLKSLGISASPYYKPYGSGLGRYTGEVVVNPAEVFAALEHLENLIPRPRMGP